MPLVEPLICSANNYANPQLLSDAYLGGCDVDRCHAMLVKNNYFCLLDWHMESKRNLWSLAEFLKPVAAWLVFRKAEVQVLKC